MNQNSKEIPTDQNTFKIRVPVISREGYTIGYNVEKRTLPVLNIGKKIGTINFPKV